MESFQETSYQDGSLQEASLETADQGESYSTESTSQPGDHENPIELGSNSETEERTDEERKALDELRMRSAGMEATFTVYMDWLVSCTMDQDMLREENYASEKEVASAVKKIEDHVEAYRTRILSQAWCEKFKLALDNQPEKESHGSGYRGKCQACNREKAIASRAVTFYGSLYDKESLQEVEEDTQDENETEDESEKEDETDQHQFTQLSDCTFKIGSFCDERSGIYHKLCHLKYHLYQSCKRKVQEVKNLLGEDARLEDIVERCIGDRGWISMHYKNMQSLFKQAVTCKYKGPKE